ncbi:transcriptional protein SWT1 [Patella vulgata]|uniref:transcriptional protein SWT1 n=1 Tax=Patella vulgata TaxID=6465 RepID=UPI0024A824D5|nr:transcriptional protein SWT1 [Patella vulgata]
MNKRESEGGPPPKLCLPFGWKVITSKTYPDRVYYFNTRTNVSAWDQPTLVTEKEYLASIPPDERSAKRAAAQKQVQKERGKPQIQTPALRDRHNPLGSPVHANQNQYTAKTPTKSGKDFIRPDQSTGSSGFIDDSVFSPDSDHQFHSDNENDLELRPELSDLQKQILENEEIETQLENKKQNVVVSRADKYKEDTSPMTFSVSDSLRTLKGSASISHKSKSRKMNPEKPKTMTFSLADNLKMIRAENQEEEANEYSDREPMTFSLADNLKTLREMETRSKKSSKKLEIKNEHKNTSEKSAMTFSLASILKNIRENDESAEAIPNQNDTPSKEQPIRSCAKTSRIVVTCTVPRSDPSNSLPQSFGKKDRPFSSRYNNKQKPKYQKKNLTTTDHKSNSSTFELFTRKRRFENLTNDGAEIKLKISRDETSDRKIVCADEKPGLATNDLRFKLKQKQGMYSVAKDEDQVEETVELPAPKKHEIQSWINSIAEADPVPSVCDFPQSPISKTSSKSDGSSVSSKDRRVVLSTECNNNNVPYDSGYSTSTGLTIGAAVALSHTKDTEVNDGEEEGMEIDDDDDDINEDEVEMMIVDLQEVREEIRSFPDQLDEAINDDIMPIKDFKNKNLYLIIDTNILVQSLKFLQNILETVIEGFGLPYIVIPWIVMQELDYIKDGKSRHNVNQFTKDKAFKAVKFLFSCLQSGHPRVRGQTPADSQQIVEGLPIDCNDDRVLQCYLRHHIKYPNACIVLLTDDINLCNKASINHMQAFTKNTVFSGLKNLVKHHGISSYRKHISQACMLQPSPSPSQSSYSTIIPEHPVITTPGGISSFKQEHPAITTPGGISQFDKRKLVDEILCQVKEEIKTGLSVVLETEMKDAFNNIWKSVVYRKPPWSALDIMECFQKHWMAVFGMILPRKKEYLVNDIVDKVKNPDMSVEDVKNLIEMVTAFMTVCETRQSYNGILRTCKRNLDDLLSKCTPVKQSKSIRFHSPPSSSLAVDDLSEIESMTDEEDLLTSLQDRFQLIWSTINDFCNHLPQLDDPAFNLSLIIPVITELKQLFSSCLTISPQDVHLNRGKFESFTHCLNAFFSRINLKSPRPLTTQTVVCYFTNPSKREILEGGLLQLDRMILNIHNYVQTL